jgi:ElaB/YqjD/DUF883 family membrane-anchored ribosome-binding protein
MLTATSSSPIQIHVPAASNASTSHPLFASRTVPPNEREDPLGVSKRHSLKQKDAKEQKYQRSKPRPRPKSSSSSSSPRSTKVITMESSNSNSNSNSNSTTTFSSSSFSEKKVDKELQIKQDEIDQLRNRVDSVLNQLVQSSIDDTQKLQAQVEEMRMGPTRLTQPAAAAAAATATAAATASEVVGATDRIPNTVTTTTTEDDLVETNEKKWVVDPYGDQGEYTGELDAEGLPFGNGTMQYTDGRVYTGEWEQGTWHGAGKAVFCNQDVFQGRYHQDQRHGYGEYKWNDGRSYAGEFYMDQRQGKGKYSWPDGAHYDGDFHKGLRHGEGRYTFNDGSAYAGEWNKGKYHGVGEVSEVAVHVCRHGLWGEDAMRE